MNTLELLAPAMSQADNIISLAGRKKRKPLVDRFWPKVERRGADECWPWLAARDGWGYGVLFVERRGEKEVFIAAHRVAYELEYGPAPAGALILHECDNPVCCNARHLKAGTHKQNSRDAAVRGRVKRKLTEARVLDILDLRNQGLGYREIARRHGVADATIGDIIRGRSWNWLTGINTAERKAA